MSFDVCKHLGNDFFLCIYLMFYFVKVIYLIQSKENLDNKIIIKRIDFQFHDSI